MIKHWKFYNNTLLTELQKRITMTFEKAGRKKRVAFLLLIRLQSKSKFMEPMLDMNILKIDEVTYE